MPNIRPEDISTEVWMGVGGVMLALLRSIIDGTRRSALQLLVGCVFGGIGAMAAAFVWSGSSWLYFICGVAAVMTENIVIGLFNFSREFADKPRDVFQWAWKLIVPAIPMFRGTGAPPTYTPDPAPQYPPAAPPVQDIGDPVPPQG